MGLVKCVLRSLRNFVIFFLLIALLPGLPPKTHFDIESFTVTKPSPLIGPLAINNFLDNTERLFENRINGPECLIRKGHDFYATVGDGHVISINGDSIKSIAQFGKPCELYEEHICGRPLGLDFDTISDSLIVADAHYGIWAVDLENGNKTLLVSSDEILDGKVRRKAKFFNSVVVSKSGDIFWTDSSSDYGRSDGLLLLLANPSGRLFHYNRATKSNKMLIDNMYLANDMVLSPNEDFIIVSETGANKLTRYYLTGHLAGTSDVFLDGLPGTPDNITPDSEGIWVPLSIPIDNDHPAVWHLLSNLPILRRFLLRFVYILKTPFKIINDIYPNYYSRAALHNIGSIELMKRFISKRSTIIRVNWNGQVIDALHGFDQSVQTITHVLQVNDYLYLGSFSNQYVGKIKLPMTFNTGVLKTNTDVPVNKRFDEL